MIIKGGRYEPDERDRVTKPALVRFETSIGGVR
jgi:hypothetical protein